MKDFAQAILFASLCLGAAVILLAVVGIVVLFRFPLNEFAEVITAFAAIGAVIMSVYNSHKIQEVHLSINSRMDQLLQATGDAQFAAGAKGEKESAKAALSSEPGTVTVPEQTLIVVEEHHQPPV